MVGSIITWGTSHLQNAPIYSWQLLFVVLGRATVLWALFIGWYLLESPMAAKCFNEDEKHLFIASVRANETDIRNRKYKIYHVKQALFDPLD